MTENESSNLWQQVIDQLTGRGRFFDDSEVEAAESLASAHLQKLALTDG